MSSDPWLELVVCIASLAVGFYAGRARRYAPVGGLALVMYALLLAIALFATSGTTRSGVLHVAFGSLSTAIGVALVWLLERGFEKGSRP